MPVTFQVVGNLADFGNDPRPDVLVRAHATPSIKVGDVAVHSNEPEAVKTDEAGAFTLELVSLPGVWYRIHTPYSGAIRTVNLAGYVPNVDDPTTGEAFPDGTVIDLIDVVDEDPTPGYEAVVYGGSATWDTLPGRPTLGTAAATDATDYATATQGEKADTAVQPDALTAGTLAVREFADSPAAGRRGARVIFVGDSHVQGSGNNGTGSDWLTVKNYPTGAGQLAWALWLSQSRLTFWGNFGMGGERTDQVYARRAAFLGTGADLAIVQMGTNDSRQSYSLAHTQQYYSATVEALLADGMDVMLVGVPPCLDGQNGQDQRNAWIAGYASRMRLPFVDSFAPVVDPATRAIATAYNGDGVHLNGLGVKVTGQKIADVIGRNYAPVEGLVAASNVDATNMLTNALGLTDATADGIPDGWSTIGAATGGTFVHTLETYPGWAGKAFCVEQVGNTNTRQFYQRVTTSSGKYAPGDRIRAALRHRVTGTVGETYANVTFAGATGRTQARVMQVKGATVDDMLASVEFVVPAGVTALDFYVAVTGGTGKAWFGQPTLTNLSRVGVTDGPA